MKTADAIRKTLTDSGFTKNGNLWEKIERIDQAEVKTTYDEVSCTLFREIGEWESSWGNIDTATKLSRTLTGLQYYKVQMK